MGITGKAQQPLTRREIECLEWLGRGFVYLEIATTLGITVATVALHVGSARKKLGAATREHALVIALRRGLIDPWGDCRRKSNVMWTGRRRPA